MNWNNILYAVLALGVLGLAFGLVLGFSSKIFAVKKDELAEKLLAALPGANCGGCGYAGCQAYAQALSKGETDPMRCCAGGQDVAEALAALVGAEVKPNTRLTALVKCSGGVHAKKKYAYIGIDDCVAAMRTGGGPNECKFGCVGLGTCVRACKFDAIHINKNGVAEVDHEKCTGCLQCTRACPKGIIVPVPYFADVNIACSSTERGGVLRKICEIGCLGCHICEKTCQYGAIKVVDNLARIDYEKCVRCGECAEKCPRHLIADARLGKNP